MARARTGMDAPAAANGHREREWARTAGFTQGQATYYDRPMLKQPTWKWFIPLYFFLGGVAGGAAALGAAAQFLGGARHRPTVRHARYLTLVLAPVCALLLIVDLGRPTRFHHMLRVFKGSSPLSVGTWVLTAFGAVSGALAAKQAAEDDFIIPRASFAGRLARVVPSGPLTAAHGLLGLALGGYTGTLLAATAVPVWAAAGILLGPLFLASSIASGAAALRLIGRITGAATRGAEEDVEDAENVATLAALGLVAAREALVPRRVGEPLRSGPWGNLFRFGAVGGGMVAPLALGLAKPLASPRLRETLSVASAGIGLAGILAERFSIVEAGKRSAADPLAYQEMTRGAPGEARPTAQQQAQRAPANAREKPFQPHQVVPAQ